jgi:PHP family Zn ribbon phosphoesterase
VYSRRGKISFLEGGGGEYGFLKTINAPASFADLV